MPEQSVSEARNSWLRKTTAGSILFLTERLHERFPKLHPNHLNLAGTLFVAAGSALVANRDPKSPEKSKTALSLALMVAGSLMDAVDGPLARIKAAEDPDSVDPKKGQIYDALSDRAQEVVAAIARACAAKKRGNIFGELVALATATTSSLPSLSRARAEVSGRVVPETGRGIVGKIGTRVGRATLGILATSFPQIKGLPLQPLADLVMTGSNIITAIDRFRIAKNNSEKPLSQESRDDARNRMTSLAVFAAIAAGGSVATFFWLNKRGKK